MSGLLYSVCGFIIAIAILVTFHELGHFCIAKLFNVKILRFSIGFGKPLLKWRWGSDRTEFVVGVVPLGGYVRMLDERENEVKDADLQRAFNKKSLFARAAIVIAGPASNLFLAVIFYWLALVIGISGLPPVVGHIVQDSLGQQVGFQIGERINFINNRPVQSWNEYHLYLVDQALKGRELQFDVTSINGEARTIKVDTTLLHEQTVFTGVLESGLGLYPKFPDVPAEIGQIMLDSPADKSGLQAGDLILSAGGSKIRNWVDLVEVISSKPGQQIKLELQRADQLLIKEVIPELVEVEGGRIGRIGIQRISDLGSTESLRLDPIQALVRGVENTFLVSEVTILAIVEMIRLRMSTESLGGPVTIARVAGQSAKSGIVPFFLFLAVISISLGILNLLPIPMLDGGHLVYLIAEAIRGKPVPTEVIIICQKLGLGILVILMTVAFYNDIARLA